jgi:antitoxin (DNA-binding transcriptional repressor) of toxin-antitoxin stability system
VDEVSVRDLRNSGEEVLARVGRGESLTVTRDGEPVGEQSTQHDGGPSASTSTSSSATTTR